MRPQILEIYKAFEITAATWAIHQDEEIWRFSEKPKTVRAFLKAYPTKGRHSDTLFEGKISVVKRQIREFWGSK
jgi:hypothetical protein